MAPQDAPSAEKTTGADLTSETAVTIAEAAADLFAEKGYVGASVREICQRAGITKPTLYYYFGSKDGLIRHIVTSTVDAFLECVSDVSGDATLEEALLHVLEQHFRFAKKRPATIALMSRLDVNPPPAEVVVNLEDIKFRSHWSLRELFVRAAQRGEIPDVDPDFCAFSFLGLMIFHGSARMQLPDVFTDSHEEAAKKLVRFMQAGTLGAPSVDNPCCASLESLKPPFKNQGSGESPEKETTHDDASKKEANQDLPDPAANLTP
ncbi:MAG: TetR/AcrR family transcriptional regulator [Deltaproteobacteria bacterium]|nr:TetR/AcrR family transcriptional regulator [Deltaproteobacteria bacterium]